MNFPAWRHYGQFYRGSRKLLLFCVGLSALQSLLVVPVAVLVRYIFDTAIPAHNINAILWICLGILSLNIIDTTTSLWLRRMTLSVTKVAIRRMREELLARCYTFPRAYYDRTDRSVLHTNIVQDTERVDAMTNSLVVQILPMLVAGTALSIVLFFLNQILFVVLFSIVPLMFIANQFLSRRAKNNVNVFRHSFEAFSKGVLFVVQNIDLTRIQTAEQMELTRQTRSLDDLRQTSANTAWLTAAYNEFQAFIAAFSGVLILGVGGYSISQGWMTLGQFMSFFAAASLLNNAVRSALPGIPNLIAGNESLNALYELLLTDADLPYSGQEPIQFKGRVQYDNVRFGYTEQPVLNGIDLLIEPGEIVAIQGPNGAGKSTLAHLLLGFYRPQQGRLLADGLPYDRVDIASLRRGIGVVMQDPIIFPGTIRENILYGHPDATEPALEQAAQLATAHDFIQRLPLGYETFVGEEGVLLSGGQRQRLAIARALLRQPQLLLLDEPTNHLDTRVVQQLLQNLQNLRPSPTIVIISHDPDVVKIARHIYTVREGLIVAHAESSS